MNLNTISLPLVGKANKIIKCQKIYQNFSSVFGGSHYTAQSFIHKEAKSEMLARISLFRKAISCLIIFFSPAHDTQWVGIPPRELNEKEAELTCHLEQAIALGNTPLSLKGLGNTMLT